ncbi:MAG: hypothetical protein AAF629_31990 [Chloroflexota bacterium]
MNSLSNTIQFPTVPADKASKIGGMADIIEHTLEVIKRDIGQDLKNPPGGQDAFELILDALTSIRHEIEV